MTKTKVPSLCKVAFERTSEQEYLLILHYGIVKLDKTLFITEKIGFGVS